jgi:hypothetical protein
VSLSKPRQVRIIGKTYSILWTSGKPLDDGDLGELDPATQRMSIRVGQPLEQEQDTVLHEVIHAIDNELNLGLREAQVRSLATGVLAVMKDNPRFSTYLRRKR